MMGRRDLSHDLTSGDPYPGDPAVSVESHARMEEDGYRVVELACSTHSGTHLDAPAHLVVDGRSLGEFDVSEFHFDARLVDCTDFGSREAIPAHRVPPSDADDNAAVSSAAVGPVNTDTDLLVFQTGWNEHWGEPTYFDHPYLTQDAAKRCVDNGYAVGLDAPSVDPTPTDEAMADEPPEYPAHEALLGAGSVILENLTALTDVPERFMLRAYPLPVDADGSPVRAVAEW